MSKMDYIDVRRATIAMLRDFRDQQWKLERMPERIREIDERLRAVRSPSAEATPVHGGGNRLEESLCAAIDQKDIAVRDLNQAQEYTRDFMPCWERLTEDERFILTAHFIDRDEGGGIQTIMRKYHIEKSEAYRRSDDALERLSKLLYW